MTRNPILTALVLIGCPLAARADVPSAANSTTPEIVRLVGSTAGVPDAAFGAFTVVVRSLANNPKANALVVVDLSQCPDVRVCADQLDPGVRVNCTAKTIQKFANELGQVSFTLLGGGNGGQAATTAAAVRIFANGVLLRTARFATYDLDGLGGVGAGDLSVWLSDFGSGTTWSRSNFDGDGNLGAFDLSMWLTAFAAGGSTQSCVASCP